MILPNYEVKGSTPVLATKTNLITLIKVVRFFLHFNLIIFWASPSVKTSGQALHCNPRPKAWDFHCDPSRGRQKHFNATTTFLLPKTIPNSCRTELVLESEIIVI